MTTIPKLDIDIGFGAADKPLPNWRKSEAVNENDPDDERIKTPDEVVAILGFDPAKE